MSFQENEKDFFMMSIATCAATEPRQLRNARAVEHAVDCPLQGMNKVEEATTGAKNDECRRERDKKTEARSGASGST